MRPGPSMLRAAILVALVTASLRAPAATVIESWARSELTDDLFGRRAAPATVPEGRPLRRDGALFDRHHRSVERFIGRLAHSSSEELADLVQTTVIEVNRAARLHEARRRLRAAVGAEP